MYKVLKHGKHVCKKGKDERDMFLMSKPEMYFKSHCRPPVSAPFDALHNRAGNSPPGGKVELERSNMAINGLPDTNSVCKRSDTNSKDKGRVIKSLSRMSIFSILDNDDDMNSGMTDTRRSWWTTMDSILSHTQSNSPTNGLLLYGVEAIGARGEK